eukprot:5153656-Pyramimonas_sp.AAC.1
MLTRVLALPKQLPLVGRPSKQPIPGSKSSKAKTQRRHAQQVARERRDCKVREWFSEQLEL